MISDNNEVLPEVLPASIDGGVPPPPTPPRSSSGVDAGEDDIPEPPPTPPGELEGEEGGEGVVGPPVIFTDGGPPSEPVDEPAAAEEEEVWQVEQQPEEKTLVKPMPRSEFPAGGVDCYLEDYEGQSSHPGSADSRAVSARDRTSREHSAQNSHGARTDSRGPSPQSQAAQDHSIHMHSGGGEQDPDTTLDMGQVTQSDGAANMRPQAPPPTPFLTKSPQEVYELEDEEVASPFQEAALNRLRELDPENEGRFTTEQTLEFVRSMCQVHEAFGKRPPKRSWRDYASCDCVVWVGILVLLVWAPILIAALLAREMVAEETGVLLSATDGLPMATAVHISHHSFPELQTMPEETLRRVRDCTFVHRGAFHRIQVASLARMPEGEVHIVAPDRSALKIIGLLNDDGPNASSRMTFSRPFYGEEEVNIDADEGISASKGCSFSNMAGAPARARPPR